MRGFNVGVFVFGVALLATFAANFLARRRAKEDSRDDLAGRSLNRWLVGLSAGTTANSGFIVTGVVGLGYSGGSQWLLLPVSWMLGDFVFWRLFPARLNQLSRESGATTLSGMLMFGLGKKSAMAISLIVSLILVACLSLYTSSQWLAGKKFLSGVLDISDTAAVIIFSVVIIAYSTLGGFRGSVYTDVVQAVIRIIGTVVALAVVAWQALGDTVTFQHNLASAGTGFLALFPEGVFPTLGFVFGFAAAALGFGLGQPQIVSRYMAGSSPAETRAAWWIYIGFVQFTWIAMTLFGIILRGVMPGIPDGETGLSVFFQTRVGPVLTGIIVADVFATIAATTNGILIAIAQIIKHDFLAPSYSGLRPEMMKLSPIIFAVGLLTILLSLHLPGNVFSIGLIAVSMIGACLAGPVMIKVMHWRHSGQSLFLSIAGGTVSAIAWHSSGLGGVVNEAVIGLATSLLVNGIFVRLRADKNIKFLP